MKNSIIIILLTASLICDLSSCSEKAAPEDVPVSNGNTVFVPNEDGAKSKITVNMEEEWRVFVSKGNSWISVSPMGGGATEVTFTVTVAGANDALSERVGWFDVRMDGKTVRFYVVQSPVDGVMPVASESFAGMSAGSVTFTVEGNVGYTVSAKDDWMQPGEVTYAEPSVLDDGVTKSRYVTSSFNVDVQSNDGNVRYGTLVIKDDTGAEHEVTVGQWGDIEADFSKSFIRRSLVVRLTSTNCGYCPGMNEEIMHAAEAYPDRIIPVNMYGYMTGDDGLVYVEYDSYADAFDVTGFPTAVVNNCARMENTVTYQADAVGHLAMEAAEDCPSETCVAGIVTEQSGTLDIDLSIASKKTGTYGIGIFVLEDSIEYYQAGKGWQYIHDNVLLNICAPVFSGEETALSSETVKHVSLSVPVPYMAADPDNLHVVVYITKKGSYTGSVRGIVYDDFCGYVVDNVTDIPVGSFTVFDYEK